MKKHAYLIMAHNQMELLKILLKKLDVQENDIYLHLDIKWHIDVNELKIVKNAGLYFVERMNVMWGGDNIVQCELCCLEMALKNGPYLYYHLLTGVDLPLKPIRLINQFYEENQGKEFINYFSLEKNNREYNPRFGYKSFLRNKCGKTRNGWLALNKILYETQRILKIRDISLENKFCLGSNFFDITESLAEELVNNKESILKLYKYGSCVDEAYIQTLVFSRKKYWDNLWIPMFDNGMKGNMRYIDFSGETEGSPKIFQIEDIDLLINSDLNFARKFDYLNYPEAIEELDNRINEKYQICQD